MPTMAVICFWQIWEAAVALAAKLSSIGLTPKGQRQEHNPQLENWALGTLIIPDELHTKLFVLAWLV